MNIIGIFVVLAIVRGVMQVCLPEDPEPRRRILFWSNIVLVFLICVLFAYVFFSVRSTLR